MPKRGSKRKKRRTHVTDAPAGAVSAGGAAEEIKIPRSIIVRAPKSTLSAPLQQLQMELRQMMAPNTAEKLREKKYNTVKDYLNVAGLLHVTHLMVLSPGGTKAKASETTVDGSTVIEGAGALLRIARIPEGPTVTLRIERYTLAPQIRQTQKKIFTNSTVFETAPLVVLNNFGSSESQATPDAPAPAPVPPHVKLMRIIFQNMFPPLDVASVRLSDCRRVVLFNYDKAKEVVEMRQYAIRATPANMSRPIKRIITASSKGKIPDLSKYEDVAEWILSGQGGDAEASDSEAEEDSKVTLPQKMAGRGNHESQTSSIKLTEIGPRVTFKLLKVEKGVCEGDVMYHAIEQRSKEEIAKIRAEKKQADELKRKRREAQEENVKRKEAVLVEKRAAKKRRREAFEARYGTDAKEQQISESEDEGDIEEDISEGGDEMSDEREISEEIGDEEEEAGENEDSGTEE